MTNEQVRACRKRQIEKLASLGDGDILKAAKLYQRCINYTLAYKRLGEETCNGDYRMTQWRYDNYIHQCDLIKKRGERLASELGNYGLDWEYPGLCPIIINCNGDNVIELFYF